MKIKNLILPSLLALSVAFLGTGCTTTKSHEASALKINATERVDLSRYTVATVVTFDQSEKARQKNAQFGETFAANVAGRLKSDSRKLSPARIVLALNSS